MSKKHPILKTVLTVTAALYTANKVIDYNAKEKNRCNSSKGSFYSWKEGDIYYTKRGQGSPVLLVHNLDSCSSSYEWSKICHKLARKHTVYALDLLGCGQSDKPAIVYTNYLYVQLLRDFIKDIIGEKTDVITSGDAASFVVMANHMDASSFGKIVMINPCDLEEMKLETNKLQMVLKEILFLPLIGTSLYNYYVREDAIRHRFERKYFSHEHPDMCRFVDIYYQSAHTGDSRGRFLYASKLCSYTNIHMAIGLANKDNLFILQSTDRKKTYAIADAYTKINDDIDVAFLSNTKLLPQLEAPERCMKIIEEWI